MNKRLQVEFTCPDCETTITAGVEVCPGCGLDIEWDEDDSTPEHDVDEILEGLKKEPLSDAAQDDPKGLELDISEDEEDNRSEDGPIKDHDPPIDEDETESEEGARDGSVKEVDIEETIVEPDHSAMDEEDGPGAMEVDEYIEEHPGPKKKSPKLYAKVFTPIGVLFIVLAILTVLALIVLYQWDVWITGNSESSLGERQMTAIYVTIILLVIFLTFSMVDVYRNKRNAIE